MGDCAHVWNWTKKLRSMNLQTGVHKIWSCHWLVELALVLGLFLCMLQAQATTYKLNGKFTKTILCYNNNVMYF